MKKYIKDMLKRKDLMIYLIISGLKAKHRNTWLGYFWWLLDPLLSMVVYYFLVVIVLGRGGPDYPAFLVIGLVVFRWFRSSVSGTARSVSGKAGIITQVYLPKAIFPIGENISQMVNFGFGLVVVSIFLLYFRIPPSAHLVWLPYVIFVQLMMHMAIGLFMGYICVFIKDIENIITHFMRIMRYAAPVIWDERLPAEYSWVTAVNPFSWILEGYRNVLMYDTAPNFERLTWILIGSLAISFYMIYFYSRNEHKIIKVL